MKLLVLPAVALMGLYLWVTVEKDVHGRDPLHLTQWQAVAAKSAPIVLLGLEAATRARASWTLVLGLLLSAAGDAFLAMEDRHAYFLQGLGAFLLAHVCYVLHFGFRPLLLDRFFAVAAVAAPVYVLYLYKPSFARSFPLGPAVAVYVSVITIMVWRALAFPSNARATGAAAAVLGAVAFMASDTILAWNMFVAKLPLAHLATMTTYYIGQFLISRSGWGPKPHDK